MKRYVMSVATSSFALAYAGCVASSDAKDGGDEQVAWKGTIERR